MDRREALEQHSKDELIDITFELRAQNERLEQRVAELEAKVNQPRKTSQNYSRAPSQDEKPNKRQKCKSGETGKGG